MKKILGILAAITMTLSINTAYAGSFNFHAGLYGIQGWNTVTDSYDVFYVGTGLQWTSDGIDNTGGYLGINNVPISSIIGLSSSLSDLAYQIGTYGYVADYSGFRNQTYSSLSGINSTVLSVTGSIQTLSSLAASINFSLTGALDSLGSLAMAMSNKQDKFTGDNTKYILGDGTYANVITNDSQIANGAGYMTGITATVSGATRTFNSAGFMVSATNVSLLVYSVRINSTSLIGSSQEGAVMLQQADNAAFTGTVTEVARVENGNSVTLAVTLQAVQNITLNLMGVALPGKYYRLATSQTVGLPTFSFVKAQETTLK